MSSSVWAYQSDAFSQHYRDSIASEINKIPSDSLKATKFYNEAMYAMRSLNDLELSRMYIDSAHWYSKASNFKDSEAKCHFLYGVLERVEGNYQKALEHLDRNIRYFKNDSTMMAYALFQVGVVHNEMGDDKNSLKTYLQILKIFEAKKDSFAIASTLNSIAVVNGGMKHHDEAISNFKRALTMFEALDQKRDVANTLKNIGEMYWMDGDSENARIYLRKSLAIAREINEKQAISQALQVLGKTYLKEELSTAFTYLSEAEQLLIDTNLVQTKISVYRDLGQFYQSQKKYNQALQYFKNALLLAENAQDIHAQKDMNNHLSEVYTDLQEFEKAYAYQKQFVTLNDSIVDMENAKAVNLLQIQFETEKKDKTLLQQAFELQQRDLEIQKKNRNMLLVSGLGVVLLILAVVSWFVFQQRQKRKNQELITLKRDYQIKSLESLIEGEEKERLRIAKELHDGVNGDLSAIKHKLSSLLEMNNQVINEAITMIDRSCEQVRAISHNLVPPSLENFNLVEATENYCANLNAISSEQISFGHLGDEIHLPKKAEINAFRIIQELVTNAIKHANAKEINVQISHRNGVVQITVEDDGKGFNKNIKERQGIGLSNIESRVEYLNATLDIISNSKGTSCTVDIDLNSSNDN